MTSDLRRRIRQHRCGVHDGFTRKYSLHTLVYFETHASKIAAATRERQLKKWNRAWKLRLIKERNPPWRDLYEMTTRTS